MHLIPCFSWLSYKLQYDLNGGTGTVPDAETYIYTNQVTVATNVPTRAGWSFTGWDTATNAAASARFAANEVVTGSDLGATTNGVTLYANWTQNVYTVTFNYRNAQEQDVSTNVTTLGTEAAAAPTDLSVDFERWDTDFSCVVCNFTVGAIYKSYYTLKFEPNGATNTMDQVSIPRDVHTYLPPCALLKPGCHFDQWTYKGDNEREYGLKNLAAIYNLGDTNQILTLTATWTANGYTIYFDANGGTGTTGMQPLKYGETCALVTSGFSRTGYAFSGWNTKADGSGTSYAAEEKVTSLVEADGGSLTLYAQWTANGYTVAFDANGGTMGTTESTNVVYTNAVYDAAFALPASGFTRTGYTFAGWGTTSNATEFAAAGTVVSNLTAVAEATNTLYAVWAANTYQIDYRPNGATSGDDQLHMTNTWLAFDAPFVLPSNTFARTGFSFAGWNTASNGTGTAYADQATVLNLATNQDDVVNLWAQWTTTRYTIHFDPNGGTGEMADMSNCLYDVEYTLPSNAFTYAGRAFVGWLDSKGEVYVDRASVSNLAATDGETVTLTACWLSKDAELKAALDLDTNDTSIVFYVSNDDNHPGTWTVASDATVGTKTITPTNGTSFLMTSGSRSCLVMETTGQGTVSFYWRTGYASVGKSSVILQLNYGDTPTGDELSGTTTDWQFVSLAVTNEATNVISWEYGKLGASEKKSAYLDHVTWTPKGANPEPTDENAPTISALASSGSGLALTFTADSRFNYQLLGTNELTAADWPVLKNIEITNETMTVDGLLDETKSQMFYKVRVIQKQ